jgi:hypothetical protein
LAGMSINVSFVATVGKWPEARKDAVFEALQAWAFEDEQLSWREVLVDILGGGLGIPLRMEAYTLFPLIISGGGSDVWMKEVEARLRKRIVDAGGEDITLVFEFPDPV